MPVIYCLLNLFDADQEIYVMQDDDTPPKLLAKVPFSELPKTLPELCHAKQIYDLHLRGDAMVLHGIVERINKEEMKKYSERKIRIEVHA